MPFWRKFKDIAFVLGPRVLEIVPGVPRDLVPVIITGIVHAEDLVHASGAEKKEHVLKLAKDALRGTNAVSGTTFDEDAIVDAVSTGIDAVVQATNGVQVGLTQRLPKTPPTP